MHGHHHHRIVGFIILLDVRIQRDFLQEARQGGLLRILHIGVDAGLQFVNVFQPGFVFLRILGGEHIGVAGAAYHLVVEFRQAHSILQKLCQLFDHGGELQKLHGSLFQRRIGIRIGYHGVQGLVLRLCQSLRHFHGFGAQTSGRVVDDAAQAQRVRPVVDDAQIGEHILDFRPIKEPGTANDTIGNAIAFHGIFQSIGLGVGTVEDGKILHAAAPGGCQNLTGHIVGLGALIRGFVDGNGIAGAVGRPEFFPLASDIMGNHRIGRIQNGLGGTVVLLQADGAAAPVLLFKAEDIFNGSAPEAVDALVVVTYHADVLIFPRQQGSEQVLHVVGILVLIHQNIAEFLLVIPADLLVLLQKLNGDIDNVVKVQGIVFLQLGLVLFIGPGNVFGPDIAGILGGLKHLSGGDHPVLLAADGTQDILRGEGFFVHVQVLQNALHHPLGVRGIIDGKAAGIAHSLDVTAENPTAGRVEGHGPNILGTGAKQGGEPVLDLIGCLIGKGDGNNAPGHRRVNGAQAVSQTAILLRGIFIHTFQECHIFLRQIHRDFTAVAAPAVTHQVGDPVDQYCGFAASGTGQQEQGPLGGQNGTALHLIELLKLRCDIFLPCGQESCFQLFCHRYTHPS